jgi:ribonuclease P protein subunit RPR2
MPARTRKPSRKPAWQKEIVLERIRVLFDQAREAFKERPERSRRYVEMAIRLSSRYNIRIPPDLKRRFCKSCHAYLLAGTNARVRTSPSQRAVIVTCLKCGRLTRHPYRREKSAKPGK